jgi:hypothetical protein
VSVVSSTARELESEVAKLVSDAPSQPGAFTGTGQTLDGKTTGPGAAAPGALNFTPQAKVIIGLVIAYAVMWYFS